jgi:hypothetical protein
MTTRETPEATRRALVLQGSAAAATAVLALQRSTGLTQALELAFPGRPGEEVLPWADQPAPTPCPSGSGGCCAGRTSTLT